MAGKIDDTENQRVIDRIKCIAFRETKDAGADFLSRRSGSEKTQRRKNFAQEW